MRLLVIASNDAHPGLEEEVRRNVHQRVDYIALARLTGGDLTAGQCQSRLNCGISRKSSAWIFGWHSVVRV